MNTALITWRKTCTTYLVALALCSPVAAYADYVLRAPLGRVDAVPQVLAPQLALLDQAGAPLPEGYAFGNVSLPGSKDGTVRVRNVGTAPATLTGVALSGDAVFSVLAGSGVCAGGVVLAPGSACDVPLSFTPAAASDYAGMLAVSMAGGAGVSAALTGAGTASAALNAYSTLDVPLTGAVSFGEVSIGSSYAGTGYAGYFLNTGTGTASLTGRSISGSTAFSVKSGDTANCLAVASLAPGQYCKVYANFSPTTEGEHSAVYTVTTSTGQTATMSLTGVGGAAAPAQLTVSSTSVDHGPALIGSTVTRSVTLSNVGGQPGTVSLSGPSAPFGMTHNCPTELQGGASCQVSFSFTPAVDGDASGVATVAGSAISLSGVGSAGQVASWSTSHVATIAAPAGGTYSWGTQTTSRAVEKRIYLPNLGTHGALGVGFAINGSSDFRITGINTAPPNSTSLYGCSSGGAIAGDGRSVSACLADDPATTGTKTMIVLTVTYTPTTLGVHNATLTPTTGNGTALPAAAGLAGTGEFNATGAWSTSHVAAVAAPAGGTYSWSPQATGQAITKKVYLPNLGTHGALGVGFAISGSSDFRVTGIGASSPNSTTVYGCRSGGAIAGDGRSVSVCLADDPATGSKSMIVLTVTYTPTTLGAHTATLTPTTSNGTALPAAVGLSGSAQ